MKSTEFYTAIRNLPFDTKAAAIAILIYDEKINFPWYMKLQMKWLKFRHGENFKAILFDQFDHFHPENLDKFYEVMIEKFPTNKNRKYIVDFYKDLLTT